MDVKRNELNRSEQNTSEAKPREQNSSDMKK